MLIYAAGDVVFKMASFRLLLLLAGTLCCSVASEKPAKFIMLSAFGSQSHMNIFFQVARGLVDRGHEVTVVSMFPPRNVKGIREIRVPELYDYFFKDPQKNTRIVGLMDPNQQSDTSSITNLFSIFTEFSHFCRIFLNNEDVKKLIADGQQYDVAINNAFLNDCSMPVAVKLARHLIQLSSASLFGPMVHSLNVPHPYAVVPTIFIANAGPMTFVERFINSVGNTLFTVGYEYFLYPALDAVIREQYDGFPTVSSAKRSTALMLTNRAAALDGSIPLLPYVQEIGGINNQKPKALPKDLEDFVQGSGSAGIIYVAFGSVVPEEHMPEKAKLAFIEAFSKIPQRVLWKFKEKRNDLPPNVKTVSWAPQQDILGHPKCRAFISHGGYNSLLETIFHGVPIIGMPVFADQPFNLARVVSKGYGVELKWADLSADVLIQRLDEVVNNTKYKQVAVTLSKIVADQPESPLDRAIFWIEYVLRHDGTQHLRTSADDLNWLQYFLLDVIAVILVTSFAIIYVTCQLIRLICCKKCRISEKRIKRRTRTLSWKSD